MGLRESGYIRDDGTRSRCDDGLAKVELGTVDLDTACIDERAASEKHVDSEIVPEAARGVVAARAGADFAHPFHDGRKVDLRFRGPSDSKTIGTAYVLESCGRAQQGLAWLRPCHLLRSSFKWLRACHLFKHFFK